MVGINKSKCVWGPARVRQAWNGGARQNGCCVCKGAGCGARAVAGHPGGTGRLPAADNGWLGPLEGAGHKGGLQPAGTSKAAAVSRRAGWNRHGCGCSAAGRGVTGVLRPGKVRTEPCGHWSDRGWPTGCERGAHSAREVGTGVGKREQRREGRWRRGSERTVALGAGRLGGDRTSVCGTQAQWEGLGPITC